MTLDQWLDRMRGEGFSFRCLTQARETGQTRKQQPAIDNWTVYGPDGHLLTSCMTRQVFEHGSDKPVGLFVFWMAETNSANDDLARLKRLDETARQRETA